MSFQIHDRVRTPKGVGTVALVLDDQHSVVALDDETMGNFPAGELTAVDPPAPPPSGGFNGYSSTLKRLPGTEFVPFSAASPFNGYASAQALHERSAQIIANILAQAQAGSGRPAPSSFVAGLSSLPIPRPSGAPADYMHPWFFSDPTDPLVELRATSNPTNLVPGTKILVPRLYLPANGTDGHAAFVLPNGDLVDLWQAKAVVNGVLSYAIGKRVRIDGNGLSSAATAAHFALPAGIVRAAELFAGHIPHALFAVVKQGSGGMDFKHGVQLPAGQKASFVYPAEHGDQVIAGGDQPPMGAYMRMNMADTEIAALTVPTWKKTLLRALAEHGMFMGDTGGGGLGIKFESGESYTALGMPDPFVEFAKANKMPQGTGAWAGTYVFDIGAGVDWTRLQVVAPPTP